MKGHSGMTTEQFSDEALEVSRIIREAMIANDAEVLRLHVAEDYRGSDAGGRTHDRDMMLAAYGPGGITLDTLEITEIEARGWENTVLLEGEAKISGHWEDQQFGHTLRFLDVYTRRNNRWLLIASQSTDIAD